MFEIKYRIVEDFRNLCAMTKEYFDQEIRDFEGQIELNFNGNKIGYVFEGEISNEMLEAGCFQDEWILLWFRNLIEVVKLLRVNNYVILAEIEGPYWIEFIKEGNYVSINKLKDISYKHPDFKSSSKIGISTSVLVETVELTTGEVFSREVEFEATEFKRCVILHKEFENEVLSKSKLLLQEVEKNIPNLTDSYVLSEFMRTLQTLLVN